MADDAVNRGLSGEQANPFLGVNTLKYLGDEVRKRSASIVVVVCCSAVAKQISMPARAIASFLSQSP